MRPKTPNAAPCEACHGASGEGSAAAPRLAGQSADYLEKQLRDYASGTRQNAIMQNFAKALSDADRSALAGYFAGLSRPGLSRPGLSRPGLARPGLSRPSTPPASTAEPRLLARGHQLAFQGAEAERVQACNNCHGPDGIGVPHSAPYLAGQSADYLATALNAWKQGTRKNDSGQLMASVVGRLSDADVAAVSAYFASVNTAPD